MSWAQQLLQASAEWRRLTEAEFASLKAFDWTGLSKWQEEKAQLQPTVSTLLERFRRECPNGAAIRRQVDAAFQELIALETANHQLLETQMQHVARQRAELGHSQRNLGRVQRSYGQSTATHWQSYS